MTKSNQHTDNLVLEVLLEQLEKSNVPETPDLDRRIYAAIDQFCGSDQDADVVSLANAREEKAKSTGNQRTVLEGVILPLAAADTGEQQPVVFTTPDGAIVFQTEEIPGDPEHRMLQAECFTSRIEEYRGCIVEVRYGEQVFVLGPINRRGLAETPVPSDLEPHQRIEYIVRKPE